MLRDIHAKEVSHGDVQPGNVILSTDGNVLLAQLVDFGGAIVDDGDETFRRGLSINPYFASGARLANFPHCRYTCSEALR